MLCIFLFQTLIAVPDDGGYPQEAGDSRGRRLRQDLPPHRIQQGPVPRGALHDGRHVTRNWSRLVLKLTCDVMFCVTRRVTLGVT